MIATAEHELELIEVGARAAASPNQENLNTDPAVRAHVIARRAARARRAG